MHDLFSARGFILDRGYYTHQYHGAAEWLTNLDIGSLRDLTDLSQAKSTAALASLVAARLSLMCTALCRRHARLCSMFLREKKWSPKRVTAATLMLPFFPLTRLISQRIERQALNEWQRERFNPAGSEMAIYFVRSPAG